VPFLWSGSVTWLKVSEFRYFLARKTAALYQLCKAYVKKYPDLVRINRFFALLLALSCRAFYGRLDERFRFAFDNGSWHVLQRYLQHFIYPLNRADLQVSFDIVRYLLEIPFIFHRNDHGFDVAPMRRQQFLL